MSLVVLFLDSVSSYLRCLTMSYSSRVVKPSRSRGYPKRSSTERRKDLISALTDSGTISMVACSFCASNSLACYYDREISVSCAECLRRGRHCDGSFSLEEFRKVGEQKKLAEAELLKKERMIAEARRRLLELEEEGIKTKEWLQHLKDTSDRMIQREMQALDVLSSRSSSDSVALGDQSLFQLPAPDPSNVDLADWFFSDDPQSFLDSSRLVSSGYVLPFVDWFLLLTYGLGNAVSVSLGSVIASLAKWCLSFGCLFG